MAEETELTLLITVVVGATDDQAARTACNALINRIGGRVVDSGDCSDEEPGCWSVTISRSAGEHGPHLGPATLSRAVRNFLRELGPEYSRHRVACEPPTAWTVVDSDELLNALVSGGERLLVEAWADGSVLLPGDSRSGDPDEPAAVAPPRIDDIGEDGRPRPRLHLRVDVVTDRRAGAEWPARALASRLSRETTVTGGGEQPPMVWIEMDLGPALGDPPEIVMTAVSALGGVGWSRMQVRQDSAVARWSAAPTPPSGIAAIELSAAEPRATPDAQPRTGL